MATRKFLERGNSIVLPADERKATDPQAGATRSDPEVQVNPVPTRGPRTAIGGMAAFMQAESVANQRLEELEREHAPYVGATPTKLIDPAKIRPSSWANRHDSAFETAEFAALKDEIAQAGGNVQAIKIRPLPVGATNQAKLESGVAYEVVFGHRRWTACLQLGLPVKAEIESLSDRELFVQMERENRGRVDLSAYEQGRMYKRALDEGLFPSMRQLADSIGIDAGNMSKALSIAHLPEAVIEAFGSPLDVQFRWAKLLSDAQQRDPEGLIARALEARRLVPRPSPTQVLAALLGSDLSPSAPARKIAGKAANVLVELDKKGRLVLKLDQVVSAAVQSEIERSIKAALK